MAATYVCIPARPKAPDPLETSELNILSIGSKRGGECVICHINDLQINSHLPSLVNAPKETQMLSPSVDGFKGDSSSIRLNKGLLPQALELSPQPPFRPRCQKTLMQKYTLHYSGV